MKTYVLIVSRVFPATHPRKGQPTYFDKKILLTLMRNEHKNLSVKATTPQGEELQPKLHTIRANYELWKDRAERINAGKAVLSIRCWTGKPYNSKQVEICQLDKNSGIGIQSLQMTALGWFVDSCDSDFTTKDFAKNDGLEPSDFSEWFRGKISIDMEPMAIIHFTKFRY